MPLTNPLVSIIIPTYNSEGTLKVALESIVNQTFKGFEVLIMDGLSTDRTLEIAKAYQKQIDGIKIFSEKDKGIYDSMNKGIKLAKGTWLYFMGSDDFFYEPTTLETFLGHEAIKTHLVVYGDVYSSRFNGVYDGAFTGVKLAEKNICHQAIFFKKEVFNRVGKFNLKYKSHADWDHNLRWFFSSKISSVYVNQIIANYADNGFSSLNNDPIFDKDKSFKLVTLGIGKLSYSELILYCNKGILEYKKQKNYLKWMASYVLRYVYRFLRRHNHFLKASK